MQGIFQKENTDKALKYGIYRHLPTYEKIIRNLVSFYYSKREKILDKTLRLNLANADKYIEGQSKVKTYLTKYGITASDLAKHYNEIVNQKVLKDWCSISDSKFSPKDYGDVTVKTEWGNW